MLEFLKDVFLCSLGAYGGPEAHYGVFTHNLVTKKKYLTEEELVELMGLCSILPGPSSTQTLVAIGYKVGGKLLAFLTIFVWALPVVLFMTFLSFVPGLLGYEDVIGRIFTVMSPMAVGFMIYGLFTIGRKVLKSSFLVVIFALSALISWFFRTPYTYPLILLGGGILQVFLSSERPLFKKIAIKPPWRMLVLFVLLAFVGVVGSYYTDNHFWDLWKKFFFYGSFVYGGGQVVIPLMVEGLVYQGGLLTTAELLAGYGIVQGLPGPMFSFSAYAGAMATRGFGGFLQGFAGILSALAIFAPGVLLIFFVYPIWEDLKGIPAIKVAISGISAAAAGLILSSVVRLVIANGFEPTVVVITVATAALLFTKKVPSPIVVLCVLLFGLLF